MSFDLGFFTQVGEVMVLVALLIRQYFSSKKHLSAVNGAVKNTQGAVSDFQAEAEKMRGEMRERFHEADRRMDEKFSNLKTSMDDRMKNFRDGIADNFIGLRNDLASLEKRIDNIDTQYVRKDVHDANLRLIEEKLRPIAEMSRAYLQANGGMKTKRREKG